MSFPFPVFIFDVYQCSEIIFFFLCLCFSFSLAYLFSPPSITLLTLDIFFCSYLPIMLVFLLLSYFFISFLFLFIYSLLLIHFVIFSFFATTIDMSTTNNGFLPSSYVLLYLVYYHLNVFRLWFLSNYSWYENYGYIVVGFCCFSFNYL